MLPTSVIKVQFGLIEFHASEEEKEKTVTFTIDNQITAPIHLIVRLMTYKQYDDEYPHLKAKYPALNPTALPDEYDQAECKFFSTD